MTESAFTIAFFGHDANESTILKRADAFLRQGCAVVGFMFRRDRVGLRSAAIFRNVELGSTRDRSYLRRLPRLVLGIWRAARAGGTLARADVIYARNIDMLAVALAAKVLTGSRAIVAYEVLDIQRPFLRQDVIGMIFRSTERLMLRRCALLVVSSPDFVDRYFAPVQGRRTGWFLLENKVPRSASVDAAAVTKPAGPPWVIGWYGTLRCRRSLTALCSLADTLGGKVEIRIGGRPSLEDLTVAEIEHAVGQRPGMRYIGGYASPADLAAIYGPVHFSWCVDYIDAGTNSDWLIPNRLYEGGLLGTIALARRDTATGRLVEGRRYGVAFDEPLEPTVLDFLRDLDAPTYDQARSRLLQASRDAFVDHNDSADLIASLRRLCGSRRIGTVPGEAEEASPAREGFHT